MDQRHIALEGNLNLRDLGGYRTKDGGRVRGGCVFRSDELHALTDADVEVLERLGIRVVFDLRNAFERNARPNRLPVGAELLERSSPAPPNVGVTIEEQIALGDLPLADDEEFAGVYIDLLDRLAPELRTILELAVDAPNRPLLFHCVAGKDRTGIAAAVVLGVLGVPDELILDDYELTTIHFTERRMLLLASLLEEHGIAEELVRPLLEARRPVLEATLRYIHERWRGFDGYALDHLMVEPDLPQRLRDALLSE